MSHTNPQRLLLAFKWMFGGIVLVSLLVCLGVVSRVNNDKLEAAQQEASFKLGRVDLHMDLVFTRFMNAVEGMRQFPDDARSLNRLARNPTSLENSSPLNGLMYRTVQLQQILWVNHEGQVVLQFEKRNGQIVQSVQGVNKPLNPQGSSSVVGTRLQDHPAWQPELFTLQAQEFAVNLAPESSSLMWLSTPWVDQGQNLGYLVLGIKLPNLSEPPFHNKNNPHEPLMDLLDATGRSITPAPSNQTSGSLADKQAALWAAMQSQPSGQTATQVWQHIDLQGRSYAGAKLRYAPMLVMLGGVNQHKLNLEKNETLRWAAILWLLGITGTALALGLGYRVARDFVVLQRREARLRRVARLGYWHYEPHTQRFEASADVWRTSGYEDAARFKLSQFMTTLLRPQDRDTFSQALDRITAEGGTFEMEALCSTRMGNEVWVNIVGKSYQHEGEPLSIEGSIQNITDRKTAELAKNAMRDFVDNVIDLAQLGVFEGDMVHMQQRVNKHTRHMLGLHDHDEPDFQVFNVSDLMHPDDIDRVKQYRRDFLSGRKAQGRVTFRARHAQGHWVSIYASSYVVARNEAGRVTLVRGVYLDVTSVELAREQAEAANRVKTEFLSRMSHELRSPLNSIMGYAQLLRMEGMNARQEDHLTSVLSGAQHMLKLVNDLLHITKNQSELAPLLKPTSLSKLVQASLNMAAPQAQERQITLSHDLSAANGVQADPLRLQQVVINLLSNAIKYSHEGAHVHILSSVLRSGHVRLTVRDQGPGIEAAVGERVFEPFYRGTQAEFGFEGAGIGLTVCKQLAEAMRGQISYQSILGVGSEFHVDLPPAVVAPEVAPEGTSVAASLAG